MCAMIPGFCLWGIGDGVRGSQAICSRGIARIAIRNRLIPALGCYRRMLGTKWQPRKCVEDVGSVPECGIKRGKFAAFLIRIWCILTPP